VGWQQRLETRAREIITKQRALQRRLRDAGVFDGRIDGSIRASTMAAIDAYMKRSQPPDGRLEQPW